MYVSKKQTNVKIPMKILTINLTPEKLEIQNSPVTIEKISNQKSCDKENAKCSHFYS